MTNPLVSVAIPVRNGERFIRQALDSVLAQSYRPVEVIVVDDGSMDTTAEIVKQYGTAVQYLYQDHQGLPAGRNRGIAASKGDFLAFLAHDDLFTPDKLEIQVGYLIAHPDIQYTVSHIKFFLEAGCAIPAGFRPELLEGDHIGRIPEAMVARKSLFTTIGPFHTHLKIADDVDWFARCKDQNVPMAVLPQVLLHKRVHGTNLSSNAMANNRELLTLLRDSIRRQKAALSTPPGESSSKGIPT